MQQTSYIVMLSHELFQGCTILVDLSVCELSRLEQDALISERMRDKISHGLLVMNMDLLVASRVHALRLHLHSPLQLGVINWACDSAHCRT